MTSVFLDPIQYPWANAAWADCLPFPRAGYPALSARISSYALRAASLLRQEDCGGSNGADTRPSLFERVDEHLGKNVRPQRRQVNSVLALRRRISIGVIGPQLMHVTGHESPSFNIVRAPFCHRNCHRTAADSHGIRRRHDGQSHITGDAEANRRVAALR